MDAIFTSQFPDLSQKDLLELIYIELRGMRLALVHVATQDGKAVPDDFDMTSTINEAEVIQQLS